MARLSNLTTIQIHRLYVLCLITCALVQLIGRDLNQYASQILNLEQFVAEEAERHLSCEEDSHNQGRPSASNDKKNNKTHSQGRLCVYLTMVPTPSDQIKQIVTDTATVSVKAAAPNKGPSAIPMEEGSWRLVPKAERYEFDLTPLSGHAQTILRHESEVREQDGAVFWPKLKQITIETFSYAQSGTLIRGWKCKQEHQM